VAERHFGGLKPTMRAALRRWMATAAFNEWDEDQHGRPVATAGKTFTAADGVITTVVCPMPDDAMFLGLAAHELIEMAHHAQGLSSPEEPRRMIGMVLADEYVTDRARTEISSGLGWRWSQLDVELGLDKQADNLVRLLPAMAVQPHPTPEFWLHWQNLARVWAMASGRRDGGMDRMDRALREWAEHPIVVDNGWSPVRETLQALYEHPQATRTTFIEFAASGVWDQLEQYGRSLWRRAKS
jgi:hypothetical protein